MGRRARQFLLSLPSLQVVDYPHLAKVGRHQVYIKDFSWVPLKDQLLTTKHAQVHCATLYAL